MAKPGFKLAIIEFEDSQSADLPEESRESGHYEGEPSTREEICKWQDQKQAASLSGLCKRGNVGNSTLRGVEVFSKHIEDGMTVEQIGGIEAGTKGV